MCFVNVNVHIAHHSYLYECAHHSYLYECAHHSYLDERRLPPLAGHIDLLRQPRESHRCPHCSVFMLRFRRDGNAQAKSHLNCKLSHSTLISIKHMHGSGRNDSLEVIRKESFDCVHPLLCCPSNTLTCQFRSCCDTRGARDMSDVVNVIPHVECW